LTPELPGGAIVFVGPWAEALAGTASTTKAEMTAADLLTTALYTPERA
jgi:hypothetical protein